MDNAEYNYVNIIEIALNPKYVTRDEAERIRNCGIPVRWMTEDESNNECVSSIIVDGRAERWLQEEIE